jgi:hypothetical protein
VIPTKEKQWTWTSPGLSLCNKIVGLWIQILMFFFSDWDSAPPRKPSFGGAEVCVSVEVKHPNVGQIPQCHEVTMEPGLKEKRDSLAMETRAYPKKTDENTDLQLDGKFIWCCV